MYNTTGIIPTKFLILIAHLSITATLLWSVEESVRTCLPENSTMDIYEAQQKQLTVGLIVTLGMIAFELLAFLSGVTMFNATSALLSITCHASACVVLCYTVFDSWQCGWYWWIFGLCSVLPTVHDTCVVFDEGTDKLRGRWTKILILAGISTTIGSALPVGYNIGVVNSPANILKKFCNESVHVNYGATLTEGELNVLWSAIVSIFLVGGTVGSLTGSWLADKLGRKGAVMVGNALAIFGGIMFFAAKLSNSVEMVIGGRLFVGLSAGLVTCVMPMYLTELAPLPLRGAMGVFCPLGVTFGVLVGQILSMGQVMGTEDAWNLLLSCYVLFVVLAGVAIPFLPESPKYLFVVRNQTDMAIIILERLRNVKRHYLDDEIEELEIEKRDEEKKGGDPWNLKRVLGDRSLLLPLLLVCSMQAGQQFSGINAVFYYSKSIFLSAGLSDLNSEYATVGAGVVNLTMAVVAIYVMSRFNRRTVFLISALSSAICLVVLGVAITFITKVSWMPYFSIVAVLSYVFCYGMGLGPIPYFIGSELFEVGPRPSAMALGSMANWGGNFIVGMTFPTMQTTIGAGSFYVFAIVTFALFIFIRLYLPETRGRDPSEIYELLNRGFASRPLESPDSSSATDETFPTDDTKSASIN